jgi:hypothetical protein
MSLTELLTLTELLDRLSKLRPDLCRYRPDCAPECYELQDGDECLPYFAPKLGKRHLSQLKGVIERTIEAEIDKPMNLWAGYITGQSLADGKFACLWAWGSEEPIKRRMQESQAIALLWCFVEALEQEAEAS